MVKAIESGGGILIPWTTVPGEGNFQRWVLMVMPVKKIHEIKKVSIIERAVPESQKFFQIVFLVVEHKVVWCVVHTPH